MPYASLSAARIVDDDAGDSRRRGVRRARRGGRRGDAGEGSVFLLVRERLGKRRPRCSFASRIYRSYTFAHTYELLRSACARSSPGGGEGRGGEIVREIGAARKDRSATITRFRARARARAPSRLASPSAACAAEGSLLSRGGGGSGGRGGVTRRPRRVENRKLRRRSRRRRLASSDRARVPPSLPLPSGPPPTRVPLCALARGMGERGKSSPRVSLV